MRINSWQYGTPELTTARAMASSCSLGDSIYVFGGVKNGNEYLNTIEWLNVPKMLIGGLGVGWGVISTGIMPLKYSFFHPLNDRELVIMGGFSEQNKMVTEHAWICDTESLYWRTVSWTVDYGLKLDHVFLYPGSERNVQDGKILALARTEQRKFQIPIVIERIGKGKDSSIHTFVPDLEFSK